jgi:hypothetical protein
MFRISPIKLAGLVAAACVAVAVPSALAMPTGPDGVSGSPSNTPGATGTEKIVVNGNNTAAYFANGCRANKLPGRKYLDSNGNPCVSAPTAADHATPAPTGTNYGDACLGGDGHTYEYYGTEAAC